MTQRASANYRSAFGVKLGRFDVGLPRWADWVVPKALYRVEPTFLTFFFSSFLSKRWIAHCSRPDPVFHRWDQVDV